MLGQGPDVPLGAHDVASGFVVPGLRQYGHAMDGHVLGVGELLRPLLHPLLQRPVLVVEGKMGLHPGAYDGRTDGFGDVIYGADRKSQRLIVYLPPGRHEDDGNLLGSRAGLQLPTHLISIHPRHHYVQKDQVGRFRGPRYLERPLPVESHLYLVIRSQYLRKNLDVLRNVVHSKHRLSAKTVVHLMFLLKEYPVPL